MQLELTTQSYKHTSQLNKPSFVANNFITTQQRKIESAKNICTIQSCSNNRFGLGTTCYEHYKHKLQYGTYHPTPFSFRRNVSREATIINNIGFDTVALTQLSSHLDNFFINPHHYILLIAKGKKARAKTRSKEYIADLIKQNKSIVFTTKVLAIRLSLVYLHFNNRNVTEAEHLKVLLSYALLPVTNNYGYNNSVKVIIGATILENFFNYLSVLADEIDTVYNLRSIQWQ